MIIDLLRPIPGASGYSGTGGSGISGYSGTLVFNDIGYIGYSEVTSETIVDSFSELTDALKTSDIMSCMGYCPAVNFLANANLH